MTYTVSSRTLYSSIPYHIILHMCYHTKIWSLYVKVYARTYGVPIILGTLGSRPLAWGRGWPLKKTTPFPICVKCSRSMWNGKSVITVYRRKIWPLAFRFQSHSTSSPTYDFLFLLVIHSNHGLSHTVSETNGENCKFPMYLTPAKAVPIIIL